MPAIFNQRIPYRSICHSVRTHFHHKGGICVLVIRMHLPELLQLHVHLFLYTRRTAQILAGSFPSDFEVIRLKHALHNRSTDLENRPQSPPQTMTLERHIQDTDKPPIHHFCCMRCSAVTLHPPSLLKRLMTLNGISRLQELHPLRMTVRFHHHSGYGHSSSCRYS